MTDTDTTTPTTRYQVGSYFPGEQEYYPTTYDSYYDALAAFARMVQNSVPKDCFCTSHGMCEPCQLWASLQSSLMNPPMSEDSKWTIHSRGRDFYLRPAVS